MKSSSKVEELNKVFADDLLLLQISMILQVDTDNSCLVGGAVRDVLLGKTPKDFDFVTDIPYDRLAELFTLAGWEVKEAGKQFLVCIVARNGRQFEIANFRKDGTYIDGRRPDAVEIGTIEDDAFHRDFTVNALYFNLTSGEVLDPTGKGLDDIDTRTLRFVGKAKDRINEDFLRVFRFFRFLAKGFEPVRKDLKVVRTFFDEAYDKTSPERVRCELEKMVDVE